MEFFWLAEELSASQERLCLKESVGNEYFIFDAEFFNSCVTNSDCISIEVQVKCGLFSLRTVVLHRRSSEFMRVLLKILLALGT